VTCRAQSRSTPAAIAFPEPVRPRWHVIDVATWSAAAGDALCKACGGRIVSSDWKAGLCPGPTPTKETP